MDVAASVYDSRVLAYLLAKHPDKVINIDVFAIGKPLLMFPDAF